MASPGMMMDHLRRSVNKGTMASIAVLVVYLVVIDPRWMAAVPICLFARACWLTRRHPEFFWTFRRRPDYWLLTIVVSVTIDGARLWGVLTGVATRLGRLCSFSPREGAPARKG